MIKYAESPPLAETQATCPDGLENIRVSRQGQNKPSNKKKSPRKYHVPPEMDAMKFG